MDYYKDFYQMLVFFKDKTNFPMSSVAYQNYLLRFIVSFSCLKYHKTATNLNKDLENVSKWAHQQKMIFNPDTNKNSTIIFFQGGHPNSIFTRTNINRSQSQKDLGPLLDSKFTFDMHFKKISGVNNSKALLKNWYFWKLQNKKNENKKTELRHSET